MMGRYRRNATLLPFCALLAGGALVACDEEAGSEPDDDAGPAAARTDAGPGAPGVDAGAPAPDAGPGGGADAGSDPMGPPDDRVGVFMLQGHMGRIALSCDDGRSWVEDHSVDDAVRCFGGGPDCDHEPNAGRGLVYADGWFLRTLGWGPPGGVERSRDGVTWERTLDETTFAGLAYDGAAIVTGSRRPRRSLDLGATWEMTGETDFTEWNVRSIGWAPYHGGVFVLIADGPEINLSTDGGATWRDPSDPPTECSGDITYGNDLLVTVNRDGVACSSSDGGESWTVSRIGEGRVNAEVVFRDGTFYVWRQGEVFTSTDAVTWTGQPTTPSNLRLGVVAVNPDTGTFAAIEGGWTQWYEDQSAYRSVDGVSWEELDASAFTGGHPARDMIFGYAEPSERCPLP